MDSETQHNVTDSVPSAYPAGETERRDAVYMPPAAQATHNRLAFWKVTAVGLCIGMTAGTVLASTGMESLLALLGIGGTPMAEPALYSAVILALGLFGAGLCAGYATIRQGNDKTELSPIRLVIPPAPVPEKPATTAGEHKKYQDKTNRFLVSTMVMADDGDGPMVDTQSREQALSAARQALLSMDHTKVTPN